MLPKISLSCYCLAHLFHLVGTDKRNGNIDYDKLIEICC